MQVEHVVPAFEDARGVIVDILDGVELRHVGLLTARRGALRGNHYHRRQWQWMYLVSGQMRIFLQDLRAGPGAPVTAVEMVAGDVLSIPPLVAHAMIASEDTVFLDLNDHPRGDGSLFEEDTVRIEIAGALSPKSR